jgi:hypothetical protein
LTIAMGGVGDLLGAVVAGWAVRRFGLGRTLIGAQLLGSATAMLIPWPVGRCSSPSRS